MPLPQLPLVALDDPNHRRRSRETINNILTHQFDDSKIRTPAERLAGVTPVNYAYPPGHVRRYGGQGDGVTNDTAALQTALDVAAASDPGAEVYANFGIYRVTSPLVFAPTSSAIRFYCSKGAVLSCQHNGNGLVVVSTNENYGGHAIENWTITGPNTFLPAGGYSPPSTGSGIHMHRGSSDFTNAVTSYNATLRDVVVQGFQFGVLMCCAIGTNMYGGFVRFNQWGIYLDGGQTNANKFYGVHVRENRKVGIYFSGRTGGSLTNATANVFNGCLIETNIPYPFASGGTPPTDSTAIYVQNSYENIWVDCYSENHAASIYLTGSSKSNQFLRHRTAPGTGRIDQIVLDGAGIYNNTFDVKCLSNSATEVSVVSNNADQLFNRFSGEGINFISGSISAPLDYSDIKPSLLYSNVIGVGCIRMPSQGYAANVNNGTDPAQIDGIGTATATLNAKGLGEVNMGSGITGNTTIIAISNLLKGQVFTLTNGQSAHNVVVKSDALNGSLVLLGAHDVTLDQVGMSITFYTNGAGKTHEIGRNFDQPAAVYTVTNGSADRSLNVTADTLAQGLAVLGTLIGDLQTKGILS